MPPTSVEATEATRAPRTDRRPTGFAGSSIRPLRRRRRAARRRQADPGAGRRLRARAATPPPSAPPTSASTSPWSSATRALGGVCLNVGCIPSKALLHAARVVAEAEEATEFGIEFGEPEDRPRPPARLEGGGRRQAHRRARRAREAAQGRGRDRRGASSPPSTRSTSTAPRSRSSTASSPPARAPRCCPDLPDDERIVDSTGALELPGIPERLLVVGGGIIGLEMATVYEALGSAVTSSS